MGFPVPVPNYRNDFFVCPVSVLKYGWDPNFLNYCITECQPNCLYYCINVVLSGSLTVCLFTVLQYY